MNIRELAPLLADRFIDLETPLINLTEYNAFLKLKTEDFAEFSKYIPNKLHDSWVIGCKEELDCLHLILNDFSTHVFADAIIEKFKIHIAHEKLVFPLTLMFSGNIDCKYYTVDYEDGRAQQIEPITIDEYLGEQVLKIEDNYIEIAIEAWHNNPEKNRPGERIVMIVSASKLTVHEGQSEAWSHLFGNEFNDYYRYFTEQFNSSRYVSDLPNCLKLVDECSNLSRTRL